MASGECGHLLPRLGASLAASLISPTFPNPFDNSAFLTVHHLAVSPELAALMRRLKTIYAITGGEVPKTVPGKKDGFNEKKSMLIAQLSNFDKLVDSRDHSGLSTDSRDYIRLKITINGELGKLEAMVKDLADTNKKEVEKRK